MFRIVKNNSGFVVEIEKKTWYGKVSWKPFITYRGTKEAFAYKCSITAEYALINEIKDMLIRNERN